MWFPFCSGKGNVLCPNECSKGAPDGGRLWLWSGTMSDTMQLPPPFWEGQFISVQSRKTNLRAGVGASQTFLQTSAKFIMSSWEFVVSTMVHVFRGRFGRSVELSRRAAPCQSRTQASLRPFCYHGLSEGAAVPGPQNVHFFHALDFDWGVLI